jgi:hypothetical protein
MRRKKKMPEVELMSPDRPDAGTPCRPYRDTKPAVLDENYEVPGQMELDFLSDHGG